MEMRESIPPRDVAKKNHTIACRHCAKQIEKSKPSRLPITVIQPPKKQGIPKSLNRSKTPSQNAGDIMVPACDVVSAQSRISR